MWSCACFISATIPDTYNINSGKLTRHWYQKGKLKVEGIFTHSWDAKPLSPLSLRALYALKSCFWTMSAVESSRVDELKCAKAQNSVLGTVQNATTYLSGALPHALCHLVLLVQFGL